MPLLLVGLDVTGSVLLKFMVPIMMMMIVGNNSKDGDVKIRQKL